MDNAYNIGHGYSQGAENARQQVTSQHGPERATVQGAAVQRAGQRGASRPRTPGRRRAPVADTARPHLSGRLAKAGPLALAMAVGGAVAAFAAPTGAPAANPPAVTCALVVPAQPLTAKGLATPYRLVGVGGQACHEGDAGTAAFVQGLVLDPATGQLSVYDPLVVDGGTRPAVAPVVPTLPANAVVALWFGFNGDTLTLVGNGVQDGSCVNGLNGSPFGQFAYCNAPALFSAAHTAITGGKLKVPALGTASDGMTCPTTRDFGIVDQDQSDNVTTTYLVLANGRTAQNTQAAGKALSGRAPQVMANGSDNLLVDHFVDPALGCQAWTAPDLADPGIMATSLGLNELQAAADQAAPVAIVPVNDPMVLDNNGNISDAKTDLYRAGVDQPPLAQTPGPGEAYCASLRTLGVQRTRTDQSLTNTTSSPDAGAATNLFTFLAMRLQQSYENLGCQQLLQQPNPVHLKLNGAGVVVGASFDQVGGATPSPSRSASASASASVGPSPSSGSASASASPVTSGSTSAAPSQSAGAGAGMSSSPAASPSKPPPAAQGSTPAASPSTPAAGTTTPAPDGTDDSSQHNPAVVGTPSGSASAPAQQSTSPAKAGSSTSQAAAVGGGAAGNGGSGAGAGTAGGTHPITAVTSTPISVAGFEHTYTSAGSSNPRSALAGPDPMADTGFDIMHSRVFWALGGALVVLCVSMLYRRRPRQPRMSRRGR